LSFLFRPEMQRLHRAQGVVTGLVESIRARPQTVLNLTEMDTALVDYVLQQLRGSDLFPFSIERGYRRLTDLRQSRQLLLNNPVAGRAVAVWTDYGFGQVIDVDVITVPLKDGTGQIGGDGAGPSVAVAVWKKFWESIRNRPVLDEKVIQERSIQLLEDGEFFFVFWTSKIDGETRVRAVPTDEITEIVSDPEDADTPLWYKRQYTGVKSVSQETIYYRDWMADEREWSDKERVLDKAWGDRGMPPGSTIAGDEATHVVMMQVAFRRKGGRGRPLLSTSGDWLEEYTKWLTARAAIAQAVYLYVDKLKAKAGTRGINALKSQLQSGLVSGTSYLDTNPPGAPASTWLENEAAERTRMPLSTGAGDAQQDEGALATMAVMSAGLNPLHIGRGELVRMAVAEEMMKPLRRQWARYQAFWTSVWKDMVHVVESMAERFGNKVVGEYRVDVAQNALVDVSPTELIDALNALTTNTVIPSEVIVKASLLILRTFLEQLGISDLDDIFGETTLSSVEAGEVAEAMSGDGGLGFTRDEMVAMLGGAQRVIARG